jgi:acyl carrier protein
MLNLILKILEEYVEVDANEISENTHFIQDLHLTSYDIVCMIGVLEEDLGIEIPDREIRNLDTVGLLCKYLEDKIL